ncbi:MAG: hypothetical protein FWG72_02835 [Oscillospiraceae bacterium]|nr:hypothetical protein [Oscillospiraceae bacterium]
MLWTMICAVLCAFGAVMAVWALVGRWFGVPLTARAEDWVSEALDGGDSGRRYTGDCLRE